MLSEETKAYLREYAREVAPDALKRDEGEWDYEHERDI